jgi:membrane protein
MSVGNKAELALLRRIDLVIRETAKETIMYAAMSSAWRILKAAVAAYVANGALSRGAAISFYAITSLAPVLLIVVAVAGLVFGQDAVRDRLAGELGGLLGAQGAELVQGLIASASNPASSIFATAFGAFMVLVTASGVFGELQSGLNTTWRASSPQHGWLSAMRARAVSLGLVASLGFLLMVSLAASAGLTALGSRYDSYLSALPALLSVLNTLVSLVIFAALFGAIYKTLPDTPIAWGDVLTGAFITAALFTAGKSLIGWYLGAAAPGSAYGAAGAPIVLMLWVYYSSQILLFGAEITKAVADDGAAPVQQST